MAIRWSQDHAAKSPHSSVRIAEAVCFVSSPTGSNRDLGQLLNPLTFTASGARPPRQPTASISNSAGAPLLPESDQPLTATDSDRGWAAAATSATGTVLFATSLSTEITPILPAVLPAVLPDGLDTAALTGGGTATGTQPAVVTAAAQNLLLNLSTSEAARAVHPRGRCTRI